MRLPRNLLPFHGFKYKSYPPLSVTMRRKLVAHICLHARHSEQANFSG
jgi:hypothetical protein